MEIVNELLTQSDITLNKDASEPKVKGKWKQELQNDLVSLKELDVLLNQKEEQYKKVRD